MQRLAQEADWCASQPDYGEHKLIVPGDWGDGSPQQQKWPKKNLFSAKNNTKTFIHL